MGDMLSQEEIDALLGGGSSTDVEPSVDQDDTNLDLLTDEQKDVLGEIGNISMGTAATTLFALLKHKVLITTPEVVCTTWEEIKGQYTVPKPSVGVSLSYIEGLEGSNVLVLDQKDVRIISNLMMGGDGIVEDDLPVTELDLSAIAEAMNQMVGSSSTSLSSMIKKKVDIAPPKAFMLDFTDEEVYAKMGITEEIVVSTSFKMEIGNLVNSQITQILPVRFAIQMVDMLKSEIQPTPDSVVAPAAQKPQPAPVPVQQAAPPPQESPQLTPPQLTPRPQYMPPPVYDEPVRMPEPNINVSAAKFQNFDYEALSQQKENIEIIMDVSLEVSVELGRTRKFIKDILEFGPGTVVELDKPSSEPIDILVNGKYVAKGEVVVIDENFGIRITDIISVEHRI